MGHQTQRASSAKTQRKNTFTKGNALTFALQWRPISIAIQSNSTVVGSLQSSAKHNAERVSFPFTGCNQFTMLYHVSNVSLTARYVAMIPLTLVTAVSQYDSITGALASQPAQTMTSHQ